jgi:hypothetical protein
MGDVVKCRGADYEINAIGVKSSFEPVAITPIPAITPITPFTPITPITPLTPIVPITPITPIPPAPIVPATQVETSVPQTAASFGQVHIMGVAVPMVA